MATIEKATDSRQLKGLKFKTQKALDGDGKDSLITEDSEGKTIVNLGTEKELFSEGKNGDELTIKEGKIVGANGQEKYAKPKYTHTITLGAPGSGCATFTIELSTNQPIDSLTDLTTILGNRVVAISGGYVMGGGSSPVQVVRAKIGTTAASCSVESINLSPYSFSDVGISSISDNVYLL